MATVDTQKQGERGDSPKYIKYTGLFDQMITLRILPETKNHLIFQAAKAKKSLQAYILEKLGIKRKYPKPQSGQKRTDIIEL